MSNKRLLVGDAVRVFMDDIGNHNKDNSRIGIGFIRFIGFIPDLETNRFTQSIGIELLQKIENGHNGKINNVQYFNVATGYGIHVPIINIIEILSTTTVMLELKNSLQLLQEKDNYIQELESIINSKRKHLPNRKPKLFTKINVGLPQAFPPSLPPSNRNTFLLPAPITPISMCYSPNTRNSMASFPSMRPSLNMQNMMVMPPDYIQNTLATHTEADSVSMSLSLTQSVESLSETFSLSGSSIPSTPITPITPNTPSTPNLNSSFMVNNDRLQRHKHSKSKSFSHRISSLHKIPVLEMRSNGRKRNKSKSKQILTAQNSRH